MNPNGPNMKANQQLSLRYFSVLTNKDIATISCASHENRNSSKNSSNCFYNSSSISDRGNNNASTELQKRLPKVCMSSIKVWEYKKSKGHSHSLDQNEILFTPQSKNDSNSDFNKNDETDFSNRYTWTPSKPKADENLLDVKEDKKLMSTLETKIEETSQRLISHLLPAGYPHSVPHTYTSFASYQFVASLSSSTAMVLSTQTLLHALGLSSQSAVPISAALNWVLKDGIGQFGGILFASYLGQGANGFDANPKQWRMVSGIALDLSTFLELISPLFPYAYFLPLASLANVGKNISFLTASASRAALHQNLAKKANLGDITAKAGSQSILASLVGTALGVGMSPFLITGQDYHSSHILLATFLVLSAIHQGGTYMSLKSVPITSLNRVRFHHILQHFVQHFSELDKQPYENQSTLVRSPIEISRLEPILFPSIPDQWLKIGYGLEEFCPDPHQFARLLLTDEKYALNYFHNDPSTTNNHDADCNPSIHLVFFHDSNGIDLVRGMLHAYTLRSLLYEISFLSKNTPKKNDEETIDIIRDSHEKMKNSIQLFEKGLHEQGWNTDSAHINLNDGNQSGYHYLKIEN